MSNTNNKSPLILSKEQAICALMLGEAISHVSFSPDEFILSRNSKIITEDNYECSWQMFWQDRTAAGFDSGWTIVDKDTAVEIAKKIGGRSAEPEFLSYFEKFDASNVSHVKRLAGDIERLRENMGKTATPFRTKFGESKKFTTIRKTPVKTDVPSPCSEIPLPDDKSESNLHFDLETIDSLNKTNELYKDVMSESRIEREDNGTSKPYDFIEVEKFLKKSNYSSNRLVVNQYDYPRLINYRVS